MRAVLILAITLLVGCASTGSKFNADNLAKLEPGITTVTEASELLGAKPTQTINREDGKQGVVWQYVNTTAFSGTEIKQAVLLFDEQGHFIRVVQTIDQN